MSSELPYSHLHLDATAIKVLAHPLRSRLLSRLRNDGPATATELAARLSTNTGATSYHLRKLESVGLVEDTAEGVGKQRVWRASTQSHGWSDADFADDEDAQTAMGWLLRDYHRTFDAQFAEWLDVADGWPAQWRDACGMSDAWVDVTPEQARAMVDEINEVVNRYYDAGKDDPRARHLHVWRFAFPQEPGRLPDSGGDA